MWRAPALPPHRLAEATREQCGRATAAFLRVLISLLFGPAILRMFDAFNDMFTAWREGRLPMPEPATRPRRTAARPSNSRARTRSHVRPAPARAKSAQRTPRARIRHPFAVLKLPPARTPPSPGFRKNRSLGLAPTHALIVTI